MRLPDLRHWVNGCCAAALLAGCAKEPPPPQLPPPSRIMLAAPPAPKPPMSPDRVIRIGHAAALTGPFAHLGRDNRHGATLAIEQANAAGITLGKVRVRFELVDVDDASTPAIALQAAEKLVASNVVAVVGHLNSGTSMRAAEVYTRAGIPMITPSATNPALTQRNPRVAFRAVASDTVVGPALVSYLTGESKVATAVVIDDLTPYGELTAELVTKAFQSAGTRVVLRAQTYAKADDAATAAKIAALNPGMVFFAGMDAAMASVMRAVRSRARPGTRFAASDGVCTDNLATVAGAAAAEGLLCSQPGLVASAAPKSFHDAYRARFPNEAPVLYSPYAYDATQALISAMRRADSAAPAAIIRELRSVAFDGATGRVEFDQHGERKHANVTVFAIRGGKLQPVAVMKGHATEQGFLFAKAATPPPNR